MGDGTIMRGHNHGEPDSVRLLLPSLNSGTGQGKVLALARARAAGWRPGLRRRASVKD